MCFVFIMVKKNNKLSYWKLLIIFILNIRVNMEIIRERYVLVWVDDSVFMSFCLKVLRNVVVWFVKDKV